MLSSCNLHRNVSNKIIPVSQKLLVKEELREADNGAELKQCKENISVIDNKEIIEIKKDVIPISQTAFSINTDADHHSHGPKADFARDSDACDLILLNDNNNSVIRAKVTEINQDEIKYKRCDNLTGPLYTIKKSEVSEIQYANGTRDVIQQNTPLTNSHYAKENFIVKVRGPFVLSSFIMALAGVLMLFTPAVLIAVTGWLLGIFGILALVFSIIALDKISNHREKYKGKGYAITALILGIIEALSFLILLAAHII